MHLVLFHDISASTAEEELVAQNVKAHGKLSLVIVQQAETRNPFLFSPKTHCFEAVKC